VPLNEYDNLIKSEPGQENEYDDVLSANNDFQRQNLKQSMKVAHSTTPEKATRVKQLADEMKMPPAIIENNLEMVERSRSQKHDYEELMENSPKLSEWLQDPERAKLVSDDLEGLQNIEAKIGRITPYQDESYTSDLIDAGQAGFNNMRSSLYLTAASEGLVDIETVAEDIAKFNKASQQTRESAPAYVQEFNNVMESEGGDINRSIAIFNRNYDRLREQSITRSLSDFTKGIEAGLDVVESAGVTVGESLDLIYEWASRPKAAFRSIIENTAHSAPALVGGATGAVIGGKTGGAVGAGVGTLGGPVGVGAGAIIGTGVGAGTGMMAGTFAGGS